MQKLVASGTKIIALDVIENATVERASMVLPAASFAESQGTLINHEGRAQRFFPGPFHRPSNACPVGSGCCNWPRSTAIVN